MQIKFALRKGDFNLQLEQVIPEQGISVIFGPSGCGKTTLLRCVAGLEENVQGQLKVGDGYWQQEGHFVPAHKRQLAYVLQTPCLFAHLSVLGNIQYAIKRAPNAKQGMLEQVVKSLGIEALLARNVQHLSGGEKQRVAIARAICTAPKVLLMDEPLVGLDSARKQEVLALIKAIPTTFGIPVLYVTHALDELVCLANHVVLLQAGEVTDSGALQDMLLRQRQTLQPDHAPISVFEARVLEINQHSGLAKVANESMNLWVKDEGFRVGEVRRFRLHVSHIGTE